MKKFVSRAGNFSTYGYAGLEDLGSANLEVRKGGESDIKAVYAQAYHVVKEVFYSNIRVQHLGTRQRQFGYDTTLTGGRTFENTADTVFEALDFQGDRSWAARLEIRLPYSSLLGNYEYIKWDLTYPVLEGNWLYMIPSEALKDLTKFRIASCEVLIKRWRNLPLRQRAERGRLTLATLLVYIMNISIGPPSHQNSIHRLREYNVWHHKTNLFFIEEPDWRELQVEPLGDDTLEKIIGKALMDKLRRGIRSHNLGRTKTVASPSKHRVRFRPTQPNSPSKSGWRQSPAMADQWSPPPLGVPGPSTPAESPLHMANRFFEGFFTDVWKIFPRGRAEDAESYLAADLEEEQLDFKAFEHQTAKELLTKRKVITVANTGRWKQKFGLCFPSKKEIMEARGKPKNSGQGWQKLKTRVQYLSWAGEEEEAKVEEIRDLMFERFLPLKWIPNFTASSHVWKPRKGELEVAVRGWDL